MAQTNSLRVSFLGFLKLLMVVAVLCWRTRSASSQRLLGCPISSLQVVSFNETLLPRSLDNIIPQIRFSTGPLVGTSFINYGPNHTDVWCAPELETFPQPLVNLIFTEPVVIVGIISGGYTYQSDSPDLDGMREYVSTFTLQHTLTDVGSGTDQFTLYSANLTGNGETEFVIDDKTVDQLVVLKKPFSALRVRLQVIERTRSPLFNITCWSMAFFGCAASEAIYEDSETTMEQPVTTPTPNEDPVTTPTPIVATITTTTTIFVTPSSTCTPDLTVTAAGQAGDQQVVSVAIPIALVTVIIVVIVVLVGIGVCIKMRGRSKLLTDRGCGLSLSPSETAGGTHYINTGTAALRGTQIADSNIDSHRERAVTIKAVENELYQPNSNRNTDSVIYEAIPSSTVTHNTIQGNGNTINSSPSPATTGAEPPPYSSLGLASPPPPSSGVGCPRVPTSLPLAIGQDENYSKVEYTAPFTPTQERAGSRKDGFQLSRNESYGSLPTAPPPHYATPTSTLRYIPEFETQANPLTHTGIAATDSDEYEPVTPLPGAAVLH